MAAMGIGARDEPAQYRGDVFGDVLVPLASVKVVNRPIVPCPAAKNWG